MSNTANSFDPRQAIEGLIGYAKDKATGLVNRDLKAKPDAQKVENAILSALTSGPKTVSQIVKEIQLTSGGVWAPTDGEASQSLTKLAESESVSVTTKKDRKVYSITPKGTEALAAARESLTEEAAKASSWSGTNFNWLACEPKFLKSASKLPPVLMDIAQTATREQQARAAEVLEKARHELHAILVEK